MKPTLGGQGVERMDGRKIGVRKDRQIREVQERGMEGRGKRRDQALDLLLALRFRNSLRIKF